MTSPARRPDDRQLRDVRSHLHAIVDRVIDAHPTVTHQAKTMGAGYPSHSLGGTAGGHATIEVDHELVPVTAVERAALEHSADPSADANDWLAAFEEWRAASINLASHLRRVLPANAETARPEVDRDKVRALCADCGERIYAGDLRNLDDQPYHATSCYYRAWRRARRTAS